MALGLYELSAASSLRPLQQSHVSSYADSGEPAVDDGRGDGVAAEDKVEPPMRKRDFPSCALTRETA